MTNPTADAPVRATRTKTRHVQTTVAGAPPQQAASWQEPCRGILYSVKEVIARVSDDMETDGIAKLLANLAYNELDRLLDVADGQDVWVDPSDIDFAVRNGPLVMLTAARLLAHLTIAADASQRVCQSANLALAEEWLILLTKTVIDLPQSFDTLREIRDGHRLTISRFPRIDIAAAIAPAPSFPPNPPTAAEGFNGYTPKQIELAFQNIASMAGTLRDHILDVGGEGGEVSPWITSIMVSQIGSVADFMSGIRVLGNPADWSIGSSFSQAGAA
jgi:hypothetical protein